jgi:hypothetical protein
MADITPVVSDISHDDTTQKTVWETLTQTNATGAKINTAEFLTLNIQATGTWDGATINAQGSNDGSTWSNLTDLQGVEIAFTADDIAQIQELPEWLRPALSGGTTSDIDVTVISRKLDISADVTSAEVVDALGYVPENSANKDAPGGYPSLIGYAVKIWNAGKTFYTSLTLAAGTAANVVHTLQGRSGTLADDTDLAAKMSIATYDTDADGIVDYAEAVPELVRNSTGATIPKGAAVYINGATGQTSTIALAQANAITAHSTIGITNEIIANNATGYVIVSGRAEGQDTSAFADGATLYVSPTVAGGLTSTIPTNPNHIIIIGTCAYSHGVNGKIQVNLKRVCIEASNVWNTPAGNIAATTIQDAVNELDTEKLAISGLGTGVATALAINVGSAGAPVVFNGAGGTPTSLTLTNATGYPGSLTQALSAASLTLDGQIIATNRAAQSPSAGAGINARHDAGAAMLSGDRLAFFAFGGATDNAGTVVNSVTMLALAAENYSATNQGADYYIATTPIGSTVAARANRVKVANDGLVTCYAGLTVAGNLSLDKTITAPGTTGAQTINKLTGRVNFAAAATSLVLTNSLITANSIIQHSFATNDATAADIKHVSAAGSVTFYLGVAPTAETAMDFSITN